MCRHRDIVSSFQGDATELQGGNSPEFLLFPRLSEGIVLSSVTFSKLRKGLLEELSPGLKIQETFMKACSNDACSKFNKKSQSS